MIKITEMERIKLALGGDETWYMSAESGWRKTRVGNNKVGTFGSGELAVYPTAISGMFLMAVNATPAYAGYEFYELTKEELEHVKWTK